MSISKVMRHAEMTVTLTGVRMFKVRLWVALRLIWLASLCLDCKIKVGGPD